MASFYYKNSDLTNARHIDNKYLKVPLKYLMNHEESFESPLKEYLYYYLGLKLFRENTLIFINRK